MSRGGFTISKLSVVGSGLPDASLPFRPGLNVIAGASNTGKTYVFQLIDFLLGASRTPKPVPLSTGYSHAEIELIPRSGGSVRTLSRSLSGGDAAEYLVPIDAIGAGVPARRLGGQHQGGDPETISGLLLALTGLQDREIRKNERGEKRSLSFRDVAHLALVDEERIITDQSPALSGQYTGATAERSAFGLFLTGVDDASIVPQEKPQERKLRLQAEMHTLHGLLTDREKQLQGLGVDVESLADQRQRVSAAIAEVVALRATQQAELDAAVAARDAAWSELQQIRSHRLFLEEQLKRLRLLQEHYTSDRNRLESAMEAGELFERLPSGECPVCGHAPDAATPTGDTELRLREFQSACASELAKIAVLARDLSTSVGTIEREDADLAGRAEVLDATLQRANAQIRGLLARRVRAADADLTKLLERQSLLAQGAIVAAEVIELRTRHSMAEQALTARTPRLKLAKKVEASGAVPFCRVVAELLHAWKFPFDGSVSWSDDRFDLVIGRENRGDLGKGFRAVAHAAFTIGLMRYCRSLSLPHPGIVVLDTPLNPFKGPDQDATERVNQEVQEAFYANLAADSSGDQVIVLENTEPPAAVRGAIQYVHFSGNPAAGRPGFFPHRELPTTDPSLSDQGDE